LKKKLDVLTDLQILGATHKSGPFTFFFSKTNLFRRMISQTENRRNEFCGRRAGGGFLPSALERSDIFLIFPWGKGIVRNLRCVRVSPLRGHVDYTESTGVLGTMLGIMRLAERGAEPLITIMCLGRKKKKRGRFGPLSEESLGTVLAAAVMGCALGRTQKRGRDSEQPRTQKNEKRRERKKGKKCC